MFNICMKEIFEDLNFYDEKILSMRRKNATLTTLTKFLIHRYKIIEETLLMSHICRICLENNLGFNNQKINYALRKLKLYKEGYHSKDDLLNIKRFSIENNNRLTNKGIKKEVNSKPSLILESLTNTKEGDLNE